MNPSPRRRHEFVAPQPPRVYSAEANEQYQAENRARREAAARAGSDELATTHPKPWRQIELDELTGAAAKFAAKALAAGREVAARRAGGCVCVGVRGGAAGPSIRRYWEGRGTTALVDGHRVSARESEAAL